MSDTTVETALTPAREEPRGELVVEHIVPDRTQFNVWVALIVLTAITVGASVYFPGHTGIVVAMLVTPAKASLILIYFMHLRFEKVVFVVMFLVAIAILAIVMGLTFVDYLFR